MRDAMEREALFIKKMEETADNAYQRGIVSFSDFLDLYERSILQKIHWREHGVTLRLSGGYDAAERQMAAFLPDEVVYEWEYPFLCLKIKVSAPKYACALNHRDYLGAVLGLGIDRRVIGDILIGDCEAYLFCREDMADFFMSELKCVGRTAVSVSICKNPQEIVKPAEEEITGTVASVRLDAAIALAFRSSRSSLVSLIEGGRVFVNGKLVTSNGYSLNSGDQISVRGMGKFRFGEVVSKTKKGRNLIRIYRYI